MVGTTEANAQYPLTVTVIDGTHLDLQWVPYSHAYVSGGTVTTSAGSGAIFTIFGKTNGWPAAGATILSLMDGTNGFELDGKQVIPNNPGAGFVVATGDVNGDGSADIIAGNLYYNNGGGVAYLVYGKQCGGNYAACTAVQSLNNGVSPIDGQNGLEFNSGYGWGWDMFHPSMADFNGDGITDVLIGSADYGQGYLSFGRQTWFPSITLTTTNGSTSATVSSYANLYVAMDLTSAGIPAGTYITACGGGDACTSTNITLSHVGTATGTNTAYISSVPIYPYLRSSSAYINGTNGIGLIVWPGNGAQAGDINGDDIADIFVKAAWTNSSAGAVYTVFGKAGSWPATPLAVSTRMNGTQGFELDGAAAGDLAGFAVSTGDINGDGFNDMAISAPGNCNGGTGCVYVYFGHRAGKPTWPAVPYNLGGL